MVEVHVNMASYLYKSHAPYHAQEQDIQFFCSIESVRHAGGLAFIYGVLFGKSLQPTPYRICTGQNGARPLSEMSDKSVDVFKTFTATKVTEEQ